jgi:excisionase family DNA binding protein
MSDSEKLFLKPSEAAHRLSLGRTALYEALSSGELRSVLRGRSRLIPVEALREFADRLETGGALATK